MAGELGDNGLPSSYVSSQTGLNKVPFPIDFIMRL